MKKTKIVISIIIIQLIFVLQVQSKSNNLKIAFIYVSPVGDAGWTYAHDQGRKAIEASDLTIEVVESVDEGIQSEPIIEYFAKNHYDIIFATSYGYMDPVLKVAKMYPDVIFMHCSGGKQSKNVGTYFGRMYQPRFLTGIIAGAMTKSNQIGFIAAYPISEVIRGINAFAIGVKSINPKAQVHVVWTKTWFDPKKEKVAAATLFDKGVDVITQHQDSPAAIIAAQKKNVYAIGYNVDMHHFAPRFHLASSVWNWSIIYENTIDQVRQGQWKSQNIWWGIKTGLVDISTISNIVPKSIRQIVMAKRKELIAGTYSVFKGPIKDQSGKIRIPMNKIASDKQLLDMKWFVEGVQGAIE
ncbi:ABC transporter substrate-binding protein [Candidatus Magnetomorum sp. HK-1]|nr:ABC transporter substrate-binding protein [Candidatus Magnetomorum sp. HK-1]